MIQLVYVMEAALVFIKIYVAQIGLSILGLCVLFVIFECVPLMFKSENTIRRNFNDFLLYQVLRSLYAVTVGALLVGFIYYLNFDFGLINILHLSHLSQALIIYLFAEFFIYIGHMSAHKFKTPLISRAHRFHHTTTTDIEWVNSKKEHLLVIALFMVVFITLSYVVFKSSGVSHVIVTSVYLLLNSFSHYRKPLTIKYLDQIFLFPKDHLRHHTIRGSGPYGVTLSLFDTLFNTRS